MAICALYSVFYKLHLLHLTTVSFRTRLYINLNSPIMKMIFTSLLLSISFIAAKGQTAPYSGSISGLWTDSNSASFQNCYLIVSEKDGEMFTCHYLEFNGKPMVEHGIGKRNGNQLTIDVTVTLPIPGWATHGSHFLRISDDGQTLYGEYQDGKGNRGPLVFKRK